ncbi:hypothetical protein [Parahaliea aestuarii]|uniref:DUF2069 domain-containing protein n=1 Tax=Parahaliea aestuarii TaxID=1852021 RepID=A0A5C9A458_9GAMM|nr:hypothetical protein [Parahaliea aestuarii]TXS94560.1 hypothetical protein FVW59_01150 [Parahaliea aestuarii]
MLTRTLLHMRQLAALLVAASGAWQVAGLWFNPLNEAHLLIALIGAAYLLLSIGLFGQSRFSLFLAMVVPALHLWFLMRLGEGLASLPAAIDLAVILLCARVFWALRHQPSV